MECVLRKNIRRGLEDVDVDCLNYFKLRASLEENRQYDPNLDIADLK